MYDPFTKVNPVVANPGPGAYNLETDTIAYKNLEKLTTGMFSSVLLKS